MKDPVQSGHLGASAKMYSKTIILIVCLSLISACGWLKNTASKILPGDSGAYPEISFTPQIKLKEIWSRSIKGVGNTYTKSLPLRQGNAVFVTDSQGTVSAFLVSNGKRIWQQSFDAAVSFGVGGSGRFLMLGTDDGKVIAFSAKQGEKIWQKQLGSGLITTISRSHQGIVLIRSTDGSITALTVADGKRLWKIKHQLPALSIQGMSVPLMFDEFGLIGLDDGRLLMVRLEDGRIVREVRVGLLPKGSDLERIIDIDGQMVIYDGVLYVANYQGRTIAIDLVNDKVQWNVEISSYSGLDADAERVYIAETGGGIVAIDRLTGSQLWLNSELSLHELGPPAVFGHFVLVGDDEGSLYWLSAEEGIILARFDTGGKLDSMVQSWRKTAIVLNRAGDLLALKVAAHAVSSER